MKAFRLHTLLMLMIALSLTACKDASGQGQDPEVTTLICAQLSESGVDREAVDIFNRTHTDVQLEIRDYFDEDEQKRLLAEIGAGKAPDIIDLGVSRSGTILLPYQQMVQKGYLEDLWPYIESDPELGRDALMEAPVEAAKIDGGLYVAFNGVSIQTLTGAESVVGSRNSWSLRDLRQAFAAMPEGSTILEYPLTKDDVFGYIFRMCLDDYVDWDTGQCSFSGDEFRTALEFVNGFPLEVDIISNKEANDEVSRRWKDGRQMLTYGSVSTFFDIQIRDAEFGGRAAYIGYPVEDGSVGSSFVPGRCRLAVSSACQDKEGAWEFVRQIFLSESSQPGSRAASESSGSGSQAPNIPEMFPINRADYDLRKEEAMVLDMGTFAHNLRYGETLYECHPVTEDEILRFERFFNCIDKFQLCDNTIYDIAQETVGPYFTGDKTLDETVALLQNRVSLYVNESR